MTDKIIKPKQTEKSPVQNGKGDAPRNMSEKYLKNYEQINWGKKSK